MRSFLLPLAIALGLGACAPKALYFHESTKIAFAADYNTSDTQPLSTSFGYKRRILAVVPAQERNIPDGGTERNGTNSGEALSLVSKFNVRAGANEGVVITNNFASGMAARIMTQSAGSPESLNVLMHSAPIPVSTSGQTDTGRPAADVVNDRIAKIMGKRTTLVPASRRTIDLAPDGGLTVKSAPRTCRNQRGRSISMSVARSRGSRRRMETRMLRCPGNPRCRRAAGLWISMRAGRPESVTRRRPEQNRRKPRRRPMCR